MFPITLTAAASLTGRSERTLWRWIADGVLTRLPEPVAGKTLVDLDSIRPYLQIPLETDDFDLVARADVLGGGGQC